MEDASHHRPGKDRPSSFFAAFLMTITGLMPSCQVSSFAFIINNERLRIPVELQDAMQDMYKEVKKLATGLQ